jgi:hypothetical protein
VCLQEVIVVEDDQGNIVRETMKDNDVLMQYRTMRETLIYLSHLDYEDTEHQVGGWVGVGCSMCVCVCVCVGVGVGDNVCGCCVDGGVFRLAAWGPAWYMVLLAARLLYGVQPAGRGSTPAWTDWSYSSTAEQWGRVAAVQRVRCKRGVSQ